MQPNLPNAGGGGGLPTTSAFPGYAAFAPAAAANATQVYWQPHFVPSEMPTTTYVNYATGATYVTPTPQQTGWSVPQGQMVFAPAPPPAFTAHHAFAVPPPPGVVSAGQHYVLQQPMQATYAPPPSYVTLAPMPPQPSASPFTSQQHVVPQAISTTVAGSTSQRPARSGPTPPAPPPPFVNTAPSAEFLASGAEGAPPLHFSPTRQKRSNRPIVLPPPAEGDLEPRQLRVSYLPTMVTDRGLVELFSPFPGYQASRVAVDATTGRALGVGFLWFDSQANALVAIQAASGRVLLGKRLRLRFETPQVRAEDYDSLAPHLRPKPDCAAGDSGDEDGEASQSTLAPATTAATE